MNLCLFTADDFIAPNVVELTGDRFQHVIQVLGCNIGDSFTAGKLNERWGRATITHIFEDRLHCSVTFESEPVAKLPLTLLMALPRPKMLKRILRTVAELGVERLILINTWKVDKSYWQTPFLAEDIIQQQFVLGLEQAKDTVMPEIIIAKRFKPFVEDELPSLIAGAQAVIAHPGCGDSAQVLNTKTCLAIGPEGGFTDYEVEKLIDIGFTPFNLGQRILRVENAVTTCIAKLFN